MVLCKIEKGVEKGSFFVVVSILLNHFWGGHWCVKTTCVGEHSLGKITPSILKGKLNTTAHRHQSSTLPHLKRYENCGTLCHMTLFHVPYFCGSWESKQGNFTAIIWFSSSVKNRCQRALVVVSDTVLSVMADTQFLDDGQTIPSSSTRSNPRQVVAKQEPARRCGQAETGVPFVTMWWVIVCFMGDSPVRGVVVAGKSVR